MADVVGMALNRDKWMDRIGTQTEGMFGEYVKMRFTQLPGGALRVPHNWEPEVERLAKDIMKTYRDTHIKGGKSKEKALIEAYVDHSTGFGSKFVAAVNKWHTGARDFRQFSMHLRSLEVDTDVWGADMLSRYLPELADIISGPQ